MVELPRLTQRTRLSNRLSHLLARAAVQGAATRTRRSRSAAKAGPRLEPNIMVAREQLRRFVGSLVQKRGQNKAEARLLCSTKARPQRAQHWHSGGLPALRCTTLATFQRSCAFL